MKASDGRKDTSELFTMSDPESDDDLSYTLMHQEPVVEDDDIHKSLSSYLKYIGNNLMRLTGRQVCWNAPFYTRECVASHL